MSEDEQKLAGEVQEQILDSARDFFAGSIGTLKGRLESDSSQLQNLLEQLPESQEDIRSQLQKLLGSYEDVGYILALVTQKQGVEDTVEQAVQQTRENVAGAGVTTENLPPGSILLGEGTDGQERTVQRSVDGSGTILESTLDANGDTVSENIVGTVADLLGEEDSEQSG